MNVNNYKELRNCLKMAKESISEDGGPVFQFFDEDATGMASAVVCSLTDDTLVATTYENGKCLLWKIGDPSFRVIYEGSAVAFSYNGELLANGGDGFVRICDLDPGIMGTAACKRTIEMNGKFSEWVKWHPRGNFVLVASKDFTISMWSINTGKKKSEFFGHNAKVTCGDFTPDGFLICTGSEDGTVRIWYPNGTIKHTVIVKKNVDEKDSFAEITCLTMNNNSNYAYIGCGDGVFRIVSILKGTVFSLPDPHSRGVTCIGLSTSHRWVATGSSDKSVIIRDSWDFWVSPIKCQHEESITCLSWLTSSKYLATGSSDGKVRVWDSTSGACYKILSDFSLNIVDIVVSAGGKYLISVSCDGFVQAFDIKKYNSREGGFYLDTDSVDEN